LVVIEIEDTLKIPIYFVLGNHDYYGGSIVDTRSRVSRFSIRSEYCHWLPESGIIELNSSTCLFGHGSWADTRYGNYMRSFVELNDYYMIEELTGKDRFGRMQVMMELAAGAALFARRYLTKGVKRYDHIYFLTHVPPFK